LKFVNSVQILYHKNVDFATQKWSNIYRMRQLYPYYKNFATLTQKLNWSHHVELLKIEDISE